METRFFLPGTVPSHTTPEWYAARERAPHLEQEGHRGRLLLAAEFVNDVLPFYGLETVSDMGCGDGGLLSLVRAKCWGYDLQPANVKAAIEERAVAARLADAIHDDVQWGDIAVCTEMLEHLIDPHAFVRSIRSRVVVASSPATETHACHYEFHTWAWDMDGYAALFTAAGFHVVRHELAGTFQVLLGVKS